MENLFHSIISMQRLLNGEAIPSVVIGGMAVAAWGEPRLTRDVDLKVLLTRQDAERLLSILAANYRPLGNRPVEMLRKQAMVFVQDSTGTRLDLLLADTPFDILAIERGRDVEVLPGVVVRLCSPEDLIIYKLISTRLRDHDDAKGVIRRQSNSLDDEYVTGWLRQFEQAFDDSTLVAEYRSLRRKFGREHPNINP